MPWPASCIMIVTTSAIHPYVHGRNGFNPGISKLDCGPISRTPALTVEFENNAINHRTMRNIATALKHCQIRCECPPIQKINPQLGKSSSHMYVAFIDLLLYYMLTRPPVPRFRIVTRKGKLRCCHQL
jgi:hypothetical protein